MALTLEELNRRFTAPTSDADRIAMKRETTRAAQVLATLAHDFVPGTREEVRAVEAIEQAMFWLHAGIDRRGPRRNWHEQATGTEPTDRTDRQ